MFFMKKDESDFNRPKMDILVSEYQFGFNEEQQRLIEDFVAGKMKTTLTGLGRKVFGYVIKDNSDEINALRNFVAKLKRKTWAHDLSDDQIKFIDNNYRNMRPMEIAMTLFPEKTDLTPVSSIVRTIDLYIRFLSGNDSENDTEDDYVLYKPPSHDSHIIKKINEVSAQNNYNPKKLTHDQKKNVEMLKGYLRSPLFLQKINSFNDIAQRKLFEETFVQSTFDKPDLNSEELNMFINLCEEYVLGSILQRHLMLINDQLESCLSDDEESKGLRMTLVEMYDSKHKEYDSCKKRQEKLQINLSNTRSNRKKTESGGARSLTALVKAWQREEERVRAIRIAMAKNEELKREKNKLESMEDYIANVVGFSEEEMFHN